MVSRVLIRGAVPVLTALFLGAGGLVNVASAQPNPPIPPLPFNDTATVSECTNGGGYVSKSTLPWRCVGGYWGGHNIVTPR